VPAACGPSPSLSFHWYFPWPSWLQQLPYTVSKVTVAFVMIQRQATGCNGLKPPPPLPHSLIYPRSPEVPKEGEMERGDGKPAWRSAEIVQQCIAGNLHLQLCKGFVLHFAFLHRYWAYGQAPRAPSTNTCKGLSFLPHESSVLPTDFSFFHSFLSRTSGLASTNISLRVLPISRSLFVAALLPDACCEPSSISQLGCVQPSHRLQTLPVPPFTAPGHPLPLPSSSLPRLLRFLNFPPALVG